MFRMVYSPEDGFDGVDDYVEVADATSLNTYATTNEITEYWLYPRGSTEQNLIANATRVM